jgi:hypothetical protein
MKQESRLFKRDIPCHHNNKWGQGDFMVELQITREVGRRPWHQVASIAVVSKSRPIRLDYTGEKYAIVIGNGNHHAWIYG